MNFESLNHLTVLELLDHGVFQVVPESDGCKVSGTVVVGKYAEVCDQLAEFNAAGAAIFVQVQGGRKRGDPAIRRATWIYLDFDGRTELPIFRLPPHLVVKTPNGFHAYWRIAPTRDFVLWRSVVHAMRDAHDSCRGVGAISQVLRLAGSTHHKGVPEEVTIHSWAPGRADFLIGDFVDIYGVTHSENFPIAANVCTGPLLRDLQCSLDKATRREFHKLVLFEQKRQVGRILSAKKGNRHRAVRDAAFCLGHYIHLGLDPEHTYNKLMFAVRQRAWSDRDLSPEQLREVVLSGLRRGYKDGPPSLPASRLERVENLKEHARLCDSVKSMAEDLPDRVTTDHIYDLIKDSALWGSKTRASHQIGRVLIAAGYSRRASRLKGRTIYERTSQAAPNPR